MDKQRGEVSVINRRCIIIEDWATEEKSIRPSKRGKKNGKWKERPHFMWRGRRHTQKRVVYQARYKIRRRGRELYPQRERIICGHNTKGNT